ncbi:hypothetical protein [Arthrobacter globiformis]|uniref:Uncharacterized protein n=1 Tax=Arthrobacter globiformis TaxID=1665 RepID=A0A328HKF3_ARTGO|nr:hypothetical protein [Arthrobacter globiformis]RAM37700.1 hypothetical protein DBZ45_08860 [Arthrobacter globiformis]
MDGFLNFMTGAEAPWWSALLGIIAGGLLTYFTTRRTMKAQAAIDRTKAQDEREHKDEEQWRLTATSHVADLIAANFRYLEYVTVTRREINSKYPRDQRTLGNRDYTKDLADALSAKGLSHTSEMQRIYSMIVISTGGAVAQAARNLILRDHDHVPELTDEEYTRTREEASVASSILMLVAQQRLSKKQEGDDPQVAHLIRTAKSVDLSQVDKHGYLKDHSANT